MTKAAVLSMVRFSMVQSSLQYSAEKQAKLLPQLIIYQIDIRLMAGMVTEATEGVTVLAIG